jgi:hypothetical protein
MRDLKRLIVVAVGLCILKSIRDIYRSSLRVTRNDTKLPHDLTCLLLVVVDLVVEEVKVGRPPF